MYSGVVLDAGQQFRHRYAEYARNLHQVCEADVLFAALDLADVRSMQSADVGELLLGPLLGHTTLMNPFAQKFQ